MKDIPPDIKRLLLEAQKKEITEYYVYLHLSEKMGGEEGEKIKKIAEDEFHHYNRIKEVSGIDVKPDRLRVFIYKIIIKIFGVIFGLKLMEEGEELSEKTYEILENNFESLKGIREEEEEHERRLISYINEERLKYVGSMILGTSDALVELTGALAGLTFALRKSSLIAVAGFITGFAASLSMAASEYLSVKAEKLGDRDPLKSAIYTGIMYITVVLILIIPFLIFSNPLISLSFSLLFAFLIIAIFTFYVSVVYEESYGSRFFEMFIIITSVAFLSFTVGILIRKFFGIEI